MIEWQTCFGTEILFIAVEEFEVLSHLEIFAYIQKSEKKKGGGNFLSLESICLQCKAKAFLSLLPTFLPSPTLPREERQGRCASQLYKLRVS